MSNVLLTHAHFQRPTILQKRRRGPLPRKVAHIRDAPRLPLGTRAELVFKASDPDNGKRVRIVNIDPGDECPIHVASLDGPLQYDNGSTGPDLWVKSSSVRRLWTGLSENERIQLRLLRGAP